MAVVLNVLFKSVKYLGMHFGIETLHNPMKEMGHEVSGAILSNGSAFWLTTTVFPFPIFLTWLRNSILTLTRKGPF